MVPQANPDAQRRARILLCAMLVAALGPPAARGGADRRITTAPDCLLIGRATDRRPLPARGDTLTLSHRLVSPASCVVRGDSSRFSAGEHFRLESAAGRIIWLGPAPAPREGRLQIDYRYLPLPLSGHWFRRTTAGAGETLAARGPAPAVMQDLPPGARLQLGGSKTFSLEFGNRQDVNLSQSLDLTVRGQLAEQVDIRAVLTDRNLPLQPEGTTAELADLDQVQIEVTSPWGGLNLGDLSVQESGFGFLAHQREMEGLRVWAAPAERRRAGAAIGRGLGRERSVEFIGENGKQGPYDLFAQQPGTEVLMVAGSERVWLDGRRLRRGEDADYTVDYSAGELRFTARNPMGSTSEIRVDYQLREGAYERNYYWLSGAAGDSSGLLAMAWMREQDDPEHSPTISLGEAERAALAAAGDSAGAALEGGVRWVGPGNGPYEYVEADSLEVPAFLYVVEPDGQMSGSYEVTFSDVGEGNGDYRDSTLAGGEKIYVYAGHERGRFVPGRQLSLPASLDVITLQGAGELGGGLHLEAEGAVSWHDRNRMSGRDDTDNGGAAMRAQGAWRMAELWGGRADLAELRFRYRGIGERFGSPQSLDTAFFHRRWNADAAVLDGHDQRGAVGLRVQPSRSIVLEGEWERLDAGAAFEGSRWQLRAARSGRLSAQGALRLGTTRAAGEEGRERRGQARLDWRPGVELGASYEGEDFERGATGTGFQQLMLNVGSGSRLPGLRVSAHGRIRWNHQWANGRRWTCNAEHQYNGEVEAGGERGLVHLVYARNELRDAGGRRLRSSDLADWTLSRRAAGGLLSGEWRGKLTMQDAVRRTESLRYVGGGGGHYDSLGHYVGSGDYDLYYVHGDSSALETRLDSALRLRSHPLRRMTASALLQAIELTLYGRVKAGTAASAGYLLARPGLLVRGENPLTDHEGTLRSELSWRGNPVWPAPRVRIEQRRATQRGASGFARRKKSLLREMEVRWKLRRDLQSQLEVSREDQYEGVVWEIAGGEASYDELIRERLATELRWRLRDPLSLRVGGELGREQLRPAGSRGETQTAEFGVVFDLRGRGRVELTTRRDWVTRDGGRQGAIFVLRDPGWRITLNGSLRLRSGVTTNLWVRTERKAGARAVITGRMEVRAFF